ncbi:MAG: YjjG family noncanonical pyrimidine nucleotidase [Dysgonomonas sp.]
MKKYTTLFFDLDDTLWDTAQNSRESMYEIYTRYNWGEFYPSFDGFYSTYLNYNTQLWDQYNKGLIKKNDLMNYRFQKLFEKYRSFSDAVSRLINDAFMHNTSLKSKTIRGSIDLLKKLKGKFKMCIISNGFSEVQYTKMKQAGLIEFFDKIYLSDVIGINKPDARIFDFALADASADRSTSIMIGDTLDTDILGALNSGIDQVWFNPQKMNTENIKPTYEITELHQLNQILGI